MPSQFLFALNYENQARFSPCGPREMFRSRGAVQCASLSLCVIFVSLSFSFSQESGFVAGRRRRRRSTGGGETLAGRERADKTRSKHKQEVGRHGRSAVRGPDGAKGNDANVSNAAGFGCRKSLL